MGTAERVQVMVIGWRRRRETIPYDSLKLVDNRIVLPGGTKQTLKILPEFKYSAK
jgi:hypothetical protein